jgi:hypothetical protein
MEPEVFTTCTQEPATDPYPEPDKHSHHHHPTVFFEDPFQYHIVYACIFQTGFSFQVFQLKFSINLSLLPCVLHAPPILFSSVFSP